MEVFARHPRPPDCPFDPDSEVDARWALLRLTHCESLAARHDELLQRPDSTTAEIRSRILLLRDRYRELAGIVPEQRDDVRLWLQNWIPNEDSH